MARLALLTVLSAALLSVPSITPINAQEATMPLLTEEALTQAAELRDAVLAENRALDILTSLVVEVGPRFAGSDGDRRALAWAQAKLAELGFERVWTEPVTVPHWVRGEASGRTVSPFPQPMVLLALGGSVATPEGGLTADVMGVESLEALAALPSGAADGKIIFIEGRMRKTSDGMGYREAVAKRGRGAIEAAKKGAAGVLIRSAGTSHHRIAHTGGMGYAEGVPKIPAAALSNADADVLSAQLERTAEPVVFHLELTTQTLPDAQSANVIAEIRGREKPEEIVLLGCHLDSWDITPGAHDDGAGCATMIEVARRIGELPQAPRRTLRVVLFANEEFGLSGARAYAEEHREELARHVAAVESDVGAARVIRFTSGGDDSARGAVGQIASLLAPLGIVYAGHANIGGADVRPLQAHGVPLFGIWQDTTDYFSLHHTIDDTLDKIDPEALDQNIAAFAAFAYAAAELEGDFGRGATP